MCYFKQYKQIIVTEELQDMLSDVIINMLVSICFNHSRLYEHEVTSRQIFEIYSFTKNDMKILGLEHMTSKGYTKVEVQNDTIILPYSTITVFVIDGEGAIIIQRGTSND